MEVIWLKNKTIRLKSLRAIKLKIVDELFNLRNDGDLSDVGNSIGYAIGKHITEKNTIDDFIVGLQHGVSIANGTHDNPKKKK